jgi:hypothetical protein
VTSRTGFPRQVVTGPLSFRGELGDGIHFVDRELDRRSTEIRFQVSEAGRAGNRHGRKGRYFRPPISDGTPIGGAQNDAWS